MPLKAAKTRHSRQFSLRTLMVIVTIACVTLALPKGYILLIAATTWMLLGAAIVWLLMRFQAPLYRFLSGMKREDK